MNYNRIRTIKSPVFTYEEVATLLGIKPESARVLCSRYVQNGLLVRLKRNQYVLKEKWDSVGEEEIFEIANRIQVPSYISLTTALSYYGITTQIQQEFVESVSVQRSFSRRILTMEFSYVKIKRDFYGEFKKVNQFFIAAPEKALLDALYLTSLGRYSLDKFALDISKINRDKVTYLLNNYPQRTKKLWSTYENI
ncbi:MAG: hypothetical protein H8E82_05560 [Candidatus Marinimicrobia bacterium]|nr:hypothetical protein [Candidatus Neomarinimicrobiota bacterium]